MRGGAGERHGHDLPGAEQGRRGPRAATTPARKTVLIVEDNELNMKLFHDLSDAHGYRTLQTRNGIDALILARTHRPILVLMDIQLPEVSGLEVVKWLKDDDELRDIPVIAVHRLRHEGRRGAHPFRRLRGLHLKPISVLMFLDTIRRFIGEAA